jgi:CRISPR-associated exonuclease Cas4
MSFALPDEEEIHELQSRLHRRDEETPLMVTDLKQWAYCKRILYYLCCLPDVRPTTYLMEVGQQEGKMEEQREIRRALKRYGLDKGRREMNLRLSSAKLGLRGVVDMVIWLEDQQPLQAVPVDFKFSRTAGAHVQMQLMAYGLMLEETAHCQSQRGYIYQIPLRKAIEVPFTASLRNKTKQELAEMHRIIRGEQMPMSAARYAQCMVCEFRRFCNDVAPPN